MGLSTKKYIAADLESLSENMTKIGLSMKEFKESLPLTHHGDEIISAAKIVNEWAEEISEEIERGQEKSKSC